MDLDKILKRCNGIVEPIAEISTDFKLVPSPLTDYDFVDVVNRPRSKNAEHCRRYRQRQKDRQQRLKRDLDEYSSIVAESDIVLPSDGADGTTTEDPPGAKLRRLELRDRILQNKSRQGASTYLSTNGSYPRPKRSQHGETYQDTYIRPIGAEYVSIPNADQEDVPSSSQCSNLCAFYWTSLLYWSQILYDCDITDTYLFDRSKQAQVHKSCQDPDCQAFLQAHCSTPGSRSGTFLQTLHQYVTRRYKLPSDNGTCSSTDTMQKDNQL